MPPATCLLGKIRPTELAVVRQWVVMRKLKNMGEAGSSQARSLWPSPQAELHWWKGPGCQVWKHFYCGYYMNKAFAN